MGGRDILWQYIIKDKILGTFGSILQHGTHGRVPVDIGILSLNVFRSSIGVGELLIDIHQGGLGITDLSMFRTVQDVFFGGGGEAIADQCLLYQVLDLFHRRDGVLHGCLTHFLCHIGEV